MAPRASGLGRGLDALIPRAGIVPAPGDTLAQIPVDSIEPNPNQPRVHFDEESLADLSASIKELGVLQPILVRPSSGGKYQLVAGERRWRAARKAGLSEIPAVVREISNLESVEQAIVENLHREDLTPLEEASAYQQLIEEFEYTHDKLASRLGKGRTSITNSLRLLQLPPKIQELLADGRLSAGSARALLGTTDLRFQEGLAIRAAAEGWSVRAVEQAVREREQGSSTDRPVDKPSKGTGKERLRPPAVLEVEQLLGDYLSTNVQVSVGSSPGKLIIEFADLEDLGRIYHEIVGQRSGE